MLTLLIVNRKTYKLHFMRQHTDAATRTHTRTFTYYTMMQRMIAQHLADICHKHVKL